MTLSNARLPGTLKDAKTFVDGEVTVVGSFHPNGTSAPSGSKGVGFNVVRDAAGEFTIYFSGSYLREVASTFTLHMSKSTGDIPQIVSQPFDVDNKSISLQTYLSGTGGTPSDITGHDHNKINFSVTFKTMNSKDGSGL